MRVVDVSSFFAPDGGGIATYYREKARWLPAAGVECHFVVPGPRRAARRFGEGMLHEVPGPRVPGGGPYRVFGDLGHLTALVAGIRPDLVELASHYVLPDLLGRAWRRRTRPALVGFYHADYPDTYVARTLGRAPRRLRRAALAASWAWVRRQHARYDATLTASRVIERKLCDRGVARVSWVGLGVDPERFCLPTACATPRPGPPRLLYVGRLAGEKGYPVLLAAMPAIHSRTGAVLDVIGRGPMAGAASSRGLSGSVRELGGRAADQVAAHMKRADALVAPGPNESFSLAAAEAMACGLPVIGADRGGNAELVGDSGGGVLFAHCDPDALADAACDLLGRPAGERRGLGLRGRAHVTGELTWTRVFARIHRRYSELVA